LVNAEQKRWLFDARDELKRVLLRFYHKQLMVFGGLFVIAALASVTVIEQVRALREILDLRVALLGLLATPFLTVGLWNIALLFALSRPRFALVSIGWGVTLNLCAGYLLSRLFSYDLAIVGFDIGSGAVAFASGWFCWKLLPNFEYHYFAATA
jgi:O-antigen/teichoic acid export membrane protein